MKFDSPELLASVRSKRPKKQEVFIAMGTPPKMFKKTSGLVLDGLALVNRADFSENEEYGITHVSSGMSVLTTKTFEQAKQVMAALLDTDVDWVNLDVTNDAARKALGLKLQPLKALAASSYEKPKKKVKVEKIETATEGKVSDLLKSWATGGVAIRDKTCERVYAVLRTVGRPIGSKGISGLVDPVRFNSQHTTTGANKFAGRLVSPISSDRAEKALETLLAAGLIAEADRGVEPTTGWNTEPINVVHATGVYTFGPSAAGVLGALLLADRCGDLYGYAVSKDDPLTKLETPAYKALSACKPTARKCKALKGKPAKKESLTEGGFKLKWCRENRVGVRYELAEEGNTYRVTAPNRQPLEGSDLVVLDLCLESFEGAA